MPHVKLYINELLCDLKGDESIEVDYSIFDVTKLGKRGGARSYEFQLPKTNRNKTNLENPEMVNSLSTSAYERLPAYVEVDGVDVLIRFCEVSSVKDAYNIRLYGSNSDLFANLSDLKLWDLDLSAWDHIWDINSVYAYMYADNGLLYAIIDYHEDSPNFAINNDNKVLDIRYMPPAFFVNTLLEKIIEGAGYTFINEIEDDTADLIMPLHFVPSQQGIFIGAKYNAVLGQDARLTVVNSSGNPIQYYFGFDTISGYTGNYYDLPYTVPNTTHRAIRLEDRIAIDILYSFNVTFQTSVNNLNILFTSYDSLGNVIQTFNLQNLHNYAAGTHTISDTLHFNTTQPVQRVMYFTFTFINTGGLYGDSSSVFIEDTSTVEILNTESWSNLIKYGNFLPVSILMPDMTQSDFIKNYILLFGLLPLVNEQTKTVTFRKFDTILSRISQAYDWSNKIDWSEEPEVSFIDDNYGQNNFFKWLQDGEESIPADTNGVIQINNKNLELEKDVVELDFAATNVNERLVDLPVNQIGIYKEGVWSNNKLPRLLMKEVRQSADIGGDITLTDTNNSIDIGINIPFTRFIGTDNEVLNLGFGNNVLDRYYGTLSGILNRVKILKLLVRLSASDISQLDYSNPVFIQKYESYFYINKPVAFCYTESKSTLVELVKLNING